MTWTVPFLFSPRVTEQSNMFFIQPSKKATGLDIISVVVFKNINYQLSLIPDSKKKTKIYWTTAWKRKCLHGLKCVSCSHEYGWMSIHLTLDPSASSLSLVTFLKQQSRKRLLITSVRTTYCAANRTNFDRFHPLLICCHYTQNQWDGKRQIPLKDEDVRYFKVSYRKLLNNLSSYGIIGRGFFLFFKFYLMSRSLYVVAKCRWHDA